MWLGGVRWGEEEKVCMRIAFKATTKNSDNAVPRANSVDGEGTKEGVYRGQRGH